MLNISFRLRLEEGGGNGMLELSSQICAGLGEMLIAKKNGETPKRKERTLEIKAFYRLLLSQGGDRTLKLVCTALGYSTAVETMRKDRQDFGRMQMGTSMKAIRHNWKKFVLPRLIELKLTDCKHTYTGEGLG